MRRRSLIAASAAVALATVSGLAAAQACTTKPVRLVVPFVPGDPINVVAPVVSDKQLAAQIAAEYEVCGKVVALQKPTLE